MSESYKESRQHVESVVRESLRHSFTEPALSQLIDAVVDGTGDKTQIERIEDRGPGEPLDLVMFDTD